MTEEALNKLCEPIGRTRQLDRLQSILESGRSTLIIVQGKSGMGKTPFMWLAAERAHKLSWKAVNIMDGITDFTEKESFESMIKEQLVGFGLPTTMSYEKRDNSIQLEIVQELQIFAPILILIDGYRPNLNFKRWFLDRFISTIKKSRYPIVVMVADRPELIRGFEKIADHKITINKISSQVVKTHFKRLNTFLLNHPLSNSEIELYTKEVVKNISVLAPITRTLLLQASEKSLKA